jgi:hypothetical protein
VKNTTFGEGKETFFLILMAQRQFLLVLQVEALQGGRNFKSTDGKRERERRKLGGVVRDTTVWRGV